MEIEVPRAKAVAAIRSDRDCVREQSVPEVEHLERARVFGLAAHRIVAARHQDCQPVVGSHAHLMRKNPRVDRLRLLHFLAECGVAIDAVDPQGARIVERNEHILGRYIGRQVNRARGQWDWIAVRRQRAGTIDAKRAHVMPVADHSAQPGRAVTRCYVEILPRRMRPYVLHIGRQCHRVAPAQLRAWHVHVIVRERGPDAGVEGNLARPRLRP
jgi:hypothetical protein